jgi:glycosyltransferase involved in cell wall biosynthesis
MFSIITPSFQQLDWLRLALASVADQEGVEVEHIIQDAGSQGVEEIFRNSAEGPVPSRGYTAKLFVEKDAGMYDAINRGLRRASGEICGYLNCDEQYLPGALSDVANYFTTHPQIDVVFGDAVLTDQGGTPISYRRTILPRLQHVRLAHLNTLSCAMFFRRRLLDRGFYFDPGLKDVGDGAWVEELLRNNVKMATIPRPLAIFAFTGENRSAMAYARREAASLMQLTGPRAWLQRRFAIIAHRIRKAMAGAYRHRNVEIEIFTLKSPDRRQRRTANRVGFKWPTGKS